MRQFDLFGNIYIKNKIVPAMPYINLKKNIFIRILKRIYNLFL